MVAVMVDDLAEDMDEIERVKGGGGKINDSISVLFTNSSFLSLVRNH